MTTEDNKQAVRRFCDAMNAHDALGAADCWASDPINHGRQVEHQDISKLLGEIVQIHERYEVMEMVAEGDWVACRIVVSGRHKIRPLIPFDGGIYQISEAEGLPFTSQHIHMFRIVNGKIKEHWATRDDLGAARQLGLELVPVKGPKET
jgi:predicted ester cyclase